MSEEDGGMQVNERSAEWRYYVVRETWVARVTDDGSRGEYLEPGGPWVADHDVWRIRNLGRQVAGLAEALREVRPPFAILPGVGIGPFLLGMTEEEVDDLCRQYGLRNEGTYDAGLYIGFHDGRATQIDFAADMGLSLAGELLLDLSNDNVRRLLATMAPPGPDWKEMDGLVVGHWDRGSDPVFSFMVYAPGHRVALSSGAPA